MAIRISGINDGVYAESSKVTKRVQEVSTDSMPITIAGEEKANNIQTSNQNQQEDKESEEEQANKNRVKSAVERTNSKIKNLKTRCEFSYHEETKRISIRVLNKETQEVIREIPPEETLEMVEKMWELAGILVDERR